MGPCWSNFQRPESSSSCWGSKVADVEKLLETQLSELARTGPTDEEMKKARARRKAQLLFGLQSTFARAHRLAEMELYRGDARLLDQELERYLAVTREDVKRVAAKYLIPSRRNVVEVKAGAFALSPAAGDKK